jgi:hypothetical protein
MCFDPLDPIRTFIAAIQKTPNHSEYLERQVGTKLKGEAELLGLKIQ